MGWTTRLPDGKIWEFPDEVTPDQVTRALLEQGAYGDVPSGFFPAVRSGIAGVTGRLGALPSLASAAITGDQEDYEAGVRALEEAERAERRHLPFPTSFGDVQEAWEEGGVGNILGTAGSYVAETAGQSAPYLVPQFAATKLGIPLLSRVSKPVERLIGPAARPGTRMLTRYGLGASSMLPVYMADNMSRQVQAGAAKAEDLSLLNATLAGAGQALAEQVFVMVMGGQGRALQRNAAQSIKDWLPKRLAEGLLEAPVEVVQQTLERLQAGESISPSDEGYMREVVEAAVGGATVGTVYAGGFSLNEARQRRKLQEAYKKAEPRERELRESELERAWQTQMGLDEQAAREQGQDALRRWQLGFREAQDTGDLEKQAAYERLEADIETTKEDVIAAAQARNIKVDDDGFRAFTERTLGEGKRHLDNLDAQETHLLYNTLTAMPVRYGAGKVEQSLPMFSDEQYQAALEYHRPKRKKVKGKKKAKKKAKAKKGEAEEEPLYSRTVTLESIRESLGFFTGSDKFNTDIAKQILTRMKSRRDIVPSKGGFVFKRKKYTEDQYSKMLNDAIDKGQLTTAIIERTLARTNPKIINEVKNDMLARDDVSKVNNRYIPKINREGELIGAVEVDKFYGWLIRDPVDNSIIGGARNRNEAREKRNRIKKDNPVWDVYVDGEVQHSYSTESARDSARSAVSRIKRQSPGSKVWKKQRTGVVSPVAEEMYSVFERTRGPAGQEGKRDNEYFDSRVLAEEAKGKLVVGLAGLNPRQDRVDQAKATEAARIDKDADRRRLEAEPTQSEVERRETVLSLLEDSLSAVGLNDIRLALVDSMSETGAEGSYSLNRIINLALDKVDPSLSYEEQARKLGEFMDHELMHGLVNLDLLDDSELEMLVNYGLRTMDPNHPNMSLVDVQKAMHEQLARREEDSRYLLTEMDAREEGMAQGYRHYNAAKNKDPDAPVAVMEKINMFFDRFGNHLAGYGFRSAEDVFDAIRAGEVGLRKRGVVRNLRLAREINDSLVETANASMRADKGESLTPDEIDSLSDEDLEKYSLDPSSIQPWQWMIPPWDSKQDDGGEAVSARFNVDIPGRSEPKSVVVDIEHYIAQAKGSWEVGFLATDEMGNLTTKLDKGAGAQATREVFATVLDIVSQFIDSKEASGEKPVSIEIDGVGKSRVRYYSTVLRRYAPKMGYEISKNLTKIGGDGTWGRWVLFDKDLKSALKTKFSIDAQMTASGNPPTITYTGPGFSPFISPAPGKSRYSLDTSMLNNLNFFSNLERVIRSAPTDKGGRLNRDFFRKIMSGDSEAGKALRAEAMYTGLDIYLDRRKSAKSFTKDEIIAWIDSQKMRVYTEDRGAPRAEDFMSVSEYLWDAGGADGILEGYRENAKETAEREWGEYVVDSLDAHEFRHKTIMNDAPFVLLRKFYDPATGYTDTMSELVPWLAGVFSKDDVLEGQLELIKRDSDSIRSRIIPYVVVVKIGEGPENGIQEKAIDPTAHEDTIDRLIYADAEVVAGEDWIAAYAEEGLHYDPIEEGGITPKRDAWPTRIAPSYPDDSSAIEVVQEKLIPELYKESNYSNQDLYSEYETEIDEYAQQEIEEMAQDHAENDPDSGGVIYPQYIMEHGSASDEEVKRWANNNGFSTFLVLSQGKDKGTDIIRNAINAADRAVTIPDDEKIQIARDMQARSRAIEYPGDTHYTHNDMDVLAHALMTSRRTDNGESVLLADELQLDFAVQAREQESAFKTDKHPDRPERPGIQERTSAFREKHFRQRRVDGMRNQFSKLVGEFHGHVLDDDVLPEFRERLATEETHVVKDGRFYDKESNTLLDTDLPEFGTDEDAKRWLRGEAVADEDYAWDSPTVRNVKSVKSIDLSKFPDLIPSSKRTDEYDFIVSVREDYDDRSSGGFYSTATSGKFVVNGNAIKGGLVKGLGAFMKVALDSRLSKDDVMYAILNKDPAFKGFERTAETRKLVGPYALDALWETRNPRYISPDGFSEWTFGPDRKNMETAIKVASLVRYIKDRAPHSLQLLDGKAVDFGITESKFGLENAYNAAIVLANLSPSSRDKLINDTMDYAIEDQTLYLDDRYGDLSEKAKELLEFPFDNGSFMAIKALIHQGVQLNRDFVAFPTGFHVSMKYPRAAKKVLSKIEYFHFADETKDNIVVELIGLDGRSLHQMEVDRDGKILPESLNIPDDTSSDDPRLNWVGRNLSEVISGGPAQKILQSNEPGSMSGSDILIGDPGLANVYDKSHKRAMESIAKRLGLKVRAINVRRFDHIQGTSIVQGNHPMKDSGSYQRYMDDIVQEYHKRNISSNMERWDVEVGGDVPIIGSPPWKSGIVEIMNGDLTLSDAREEFGPFSVVDSSQYETVWGLDIRDIGKRLEKDSRTLDSMFSSFHTKFSLSTEKIPSSIDVIIPGADALSVGVNQDYSGLSKIVADGTEMPLEYRSADSSDSPPGMRVISDNSGNTYAWPYGAATVRDVKSSVRGISFPTNNIAGYIQGNNIANLPPKTKLSRSDIPDRINVKHSIYLPNGIASQVFDDGITRINTDRDISTLDEWLAITTNGNSRAIGLTKLSLDPDGISESKYSFKIEDTIRFPEALNVDSDGTTRPGEVTPVNELMGMEDYDSVTFHQVGSSLGPYSDYNIKEIFNTTKMSLPWTMGGETGDLYITRVGTRAGEVFKERQSSNDIALSTDKDVLLPDYLYYVLQSLYPKINARRSGSVISTIRKSDINDTLMGFFQAERPKLSLPATPDESVSTDETIETVQQLDPNMNDNGTIKWINENATERNKQIARGEIKGEKLSENQKKKYSLAAGQPNFAGDIPNIIRRAVTIKQDQTLFEKISHFMNKENRPEFWEWLRQKALNQYEKAGWMGLKIAEETGNDAYLMAAVSSMSAALNSDKARGMFTYLLEKGIPILKTGVAGGLEASWATTAPFEITMPDGSKRQGGLRTLLTPLFANNQNLYPLWSSFMIARREHRFEAMGKEVRMNAESRQKIFDEVGYNPETKTWTNSKYPNLEIVDKNYQAWNSAFVDFMVATGAFTKSEAEIYKSYADYIPFYRQFDGESNAELDANISGLIQEEDKIRGVPRKARPPSMFHSMTGVQGARAAKGGEAKIDDPLENILQNAFAGLQAGMKNLAAQKVMRDAEHLNLAEPTDNAGDSTHTLRIDGIDKHFIVKDDLVFEVLSGVMDARMPWLEMLSKPARWLRELITRSPDFLAANLLRDTGSAWVTSGADFTPFTGALKNMFSGQADPRWEALERAGVASGFENMNNPEDFRKYIEKQWKREGVTEDASDVWKFFDKIWTGSGMLSTRSDMAVRMDVWQDVVSRMEAEGKHDRSVIEAEADFQASETLNFGRRGSSPYYRILTALVPFTGARIQGLDVLYRAGAGKYGTDYAAVQSGAALMRFRQRALMVLSLAAMYWLLVHDDDDYLGQTDETRDMNLIIPSSMLPGDSPLKFPKPFEVGFLLITVPEAFLSWLNDDTDNRDAINTLKRGMIATLHLNPMPQAAKPVYEVFSNYSSWTGRNVVPEHQLDLDPHLQYTDATGEFARLLGKTFGGSPLQIEHVIRGYTGTLGSYGLFLVDEATRAMSDLPSRPPLELSDFPMFRRFIGKPGGETRGDLQKFYDLREVSDMAFNSWRKLRRDGRHEEARELRRDREAIFGTRGRVLGMDRRVSAIRKRMQRIMLSDIDPTEKNQKIEGARRELERALSDLDKVRMESDLPIDLRVFS